MTALALARFTFVEALRRRLVLASLLLTLLFLILYAVGTHYAVRELEGSRLILPSLRPAVIGQLLLAGAWVVSMASALLAIFAASGTISGEVESYTLQAVAAKPVRRWEIVAGKWLGLVAIAGTYTAITCLLVQSIVWLRSGYAGSAPLAAAGALTAQTVVLVSAAMLASALAPTLAAGISVFMLHAIAISGGLVEEFGTLLANRTMLDIGLWISLAMPSDVMWKLSASWLQPQILSSLPTAGPLSVLTPPSFWMLGYALLYALLALALAMLRFEGRDL